MKKILVVLLTIIMAFSFCMPCFAGVQGTTYYVDSVNGDDNASGLSEQSAWKTIAKAREKTYSAGDEILFKAGGIYNGNFVAYGNGTADMPITLGSYGDTEADGLPIFRNDDADTVLCLIQNVKGWTVENIEFTAPDGHGIFVYAVGDGQTEDIVIKNCVFHDITNKPLITRYPILLASNSAVARLNNITIKDCNIYDCGYGISMSGLSREWSKDAFTTEYDSYNHNYVIDGVSLNNILYDAIIIMSIYGMTIRNCSLIDTCLLDDHYTAPMWSHHASHFIIENCEIAGALNEKDGMAVDFDGWTTDATYQYIYSHDNVRFINNCCYDNYTCNRNCTVRYCLSVNDNKCGNNMAQMLTSGSVDYNEDEYPRHMDNFKFYNNTIINGSEFNLIGLKDSYIANNIFTGNMTSAFRFTRKTYDENGDKLILSFDGKMTNNCFWGTPVPTIAKNSYTCNPKFVGTDENDMNSYMLSSKSKLLGKGLKVEEDMGETDLYGNALTDSINIGCYGGNGENVKAKTNAFDFISSKINTILGVIYNFVYMCTDRYWLF